MSRLLKYRGDRVDAPAIDEASGAANAALDVLDRRMPGKVNAVSVVEEAGELRVVLPADAPPGALAEASVAVHAVSSRARVLRDGDTHKALATLRVSKKGRAPPLACLGMLACGGFAAGLGRPGRRK